MTEAFEKIRRRYMVFVEDGEEVHFTERGIRASLIAGSVVGFTISNVGLAYLFQGQAIPTADTIRTVIVAVAVTVAYYEHSSKWVDWADHLGLLYHEEGDEDAE